AAQKPVRLHPTEVGAANRKPCAFPPELARSNVCIARVPVRHLNPAPLHSVGSEPSSFVRRQGSVPCRRAIHGLSDGVPRPARTISGRKGRAALLLPA